MRLDSGLALPLLFPEAGDPGLDDPELLPHIDFANPKTALVTLAAIWVAKVVAEKRGRPELEEA
jgi:hypothetical protein